MEIELPEQNRWYFVFAFFFGTMGFIISTFRSDIVWAGVSLLYLALIYGISKIEWESNIQRDIFSWPLLPLFLGVTGISIFLSSRWIFGDVAFAAMAPILGFMIILNLTYHTKFRTDLYFSASFILLFTLAAGTVWGIVQFMGDRSFGSTALPGNDKLMIQFVFIAVAGLIASYIFKRYRKTYYLKGKNYSILNKIRSGFVMESKDPRGDLWDVIYSFFGSGDDDVLIPISRALQLGIIGLAVFALMIYNLWAFFLAIPSFILSILPTVYDRYFKEDVPVLFQFWISVTLFLYVMGETAGFQSRFDWWNMMTHITAGIVVGALIFISVYYINQISETVYIPDWMMPALVLTFILSISLVWELFEFSLDAILSTGLQPRLEDTVFDMISNFVGAVIALLLTALFTPYQS
ncbi:MAG: hypothetical protein KGY76_06630, partial [Candidatus Thermoplasmatota archaeon]|nr:hypothetical protein [Candidatus Thermoplasmatota archaeon]